MEKNIKRPKVGMILLQGDPSAENYKDLVSQSWVNGGFEMEYHEAVTPKTMHIAQRLKKLKFGKKDGGRNKGKYLTPTEKAIWYSHMYMWSIAARKASPFIIIEHDVMLMAPIPLSVLSTHPIVGLSHCGLLPKHPERGYRVSAGGAYYITNAIAKQMIDEVPEKITYNSDGFIHNYITRYGTWNHRHSTQIYIDKFGSTIDHG